MLKEVKIAIVVSLFNPEITKKLLQGTVDKLIDLGLNENQVKIFEVPGAVEIPLAAKLLALTKKYQAIICLGAVIRGDTDHYHYVCEQVSRGCQQVMLECNIPVIFGVLTTKNEKQAMQRVTKPSHHKGIEAAEAAVRMIQLLERIDAIAADD